MLRKTPFRQIAIIFTFLVLTVIGWHAAVGGLNQWSRATGPGQLTETILQLVCALLCIVVMLTAFIRTRPVTFLRYGWGLSFVATVVSSTLVWGPPMILPTVFLGALSVGLAFGVIFVLEKRLYGAR